ncbi:MAG: hypothetical protein AAGA66_00990 [Bacteroidota bacterium]
MEDRELKDKLPMDEPTSSEKEVLTGFKEDAMRLLQHTHHWSPSEAATIFHDACLLVLDQLTNKKIDEINKSYFLKVCKNLGANTYRRALKEKMTFASYRDEIQQEYQKTIQNNYGITLFDAAPDESRSQKALRAFSMLSEKCQKIIRAKYVDELSHKHIAQQSVHVNSENSAKTVLSRCLKYWKKLNKQLK